MTEASHATAPAIELHDLTVAYGSQPVLWDIDVKLPEGRLIAIVGPNGAGKSTMLKTILDQVKPTTGWVKIFTPWGCPTSVRCQCAVENRVQPDAT